MEKKHICAGCYGTISADDKGQFVRHTLHFHDINCERRFNWRVNGQFMDVIRELKRGERKIQ